MSAVRATLAAVPTRSSGSPAACNRDGFCLILSRSGLRSPSSGVPPRERKIAFRTLPAIATLHRDKITYVIRDRFLGGGSFRNGWLFSPRDPRRGLHPPAGLLGRTDSWARTLTGVPGKLKYTGAEEESDPELHEGTDSFRLTGRPPRATCILRNSGSVPNFPRKTHHRSDRSSNELSVVQ